MFEKDDIFEMFFLNIKKLFFPETWLNLDLKFSKTEIFALLFLDQKKEVTMTDLAAYLNSPMSTANGIINRLVGKDYVKRERSEEDRRIVVLRLTSLGSEFVNGIKEMVSGFYQAVMEGLSAEERQFLIKTVFKVLDNLQDKFTREISPVSEQTIKKIEID